MNIRLCAARSLAAWTLAAGACTVAIAQTPTFAPPQNVLQLSASGQVEVQQDLLSLSLTTTREGTDPNAVQSQLKAALDAALAEARKAAQPGQLDVRTGNFSLYPRHGRDGKISGWNGTAELVLEGRDFGRITQTAAKIQTMTLGGVSFGLSREQRAKVEGEAQAVAIERFKAKAGELAKGFGFSGYSLREVTVNANDQGFVPRPRMMAMEAKAAQADMPVPVEAGKSIVMVTVSGSVQLR
ncbi:SIMPL domain-containing protein [Caenimonas soli]|uniref:SIMPL domain-containing protein n=1 Tax=Caenimonas soli TaxID=2735555 RepID=UPI00155460C1|nr:SIMPL domain-containing protein [Caenimonas soli]NPC54499.1 SIMPL domain-containing protein [Caenimonas soli]